MSEPAEDPFTGNNLDLIEAARALLDLDKAGALAPHGIGSHARTIIKSFMLRLPVTDLSRDPWIQADA